MLNFSVHLIKRPPDVAFLHFLDIHTFLTKNECIFANVECSIVFSDIFVHFSGNTTNISYISTCQGLIFAWWSSHLPWILASYLEFQVYHYNKNSKIYSYLWSMRTFLISYVHRHAFDTNTPQTCVGDPWLCLLKCSKTCQNTPSTHRHARPCYVELDIFYWPTIFKHGKHGTLWFSQSWISKC